MVAWNGRLGDTRKYNNNNNNSKVSPVKKEGLDGQGGAYVFLCCSSGKMEKEGKEAKKPKGMEEGEREEEGLFLSLVNGTCIHPNHVKAHQQTNMQQTQSHLLICYFRLFALFL